MAKFTFDLLTGKEYLFITEISGGTAVSGSTYPEVNLFNELPNPLIYSGKIYVVRSGSGDYVHDRKDAGLYLSNGSDWNRLGDTPSYFSSTNFQIYDGISNTKGVKFITSGISSNTYRKIKFQDSDGTIALSSDVNLKLDKSAFNTYSGTTVPANYYNKTQINNYTGTTVPANYYNKIQINTYTGTTAPNTYLSKSAFSTYSGTTVPANYYNKTQINNYTGYTNTIVNKVKNYLGNGIIEGFVITQHPPTSASTKIDISSGVGYFIDNYTNPELPTGLTLIYTGKTGITLNYLNSNLITYIAIDRSGNTVQQTTYFTSAQRREYLIIGAAIHSNKTTINAINNLPDVVLDGHNQFNDLLDSLKNFNKEGNIFSANGANLSINKSAGKIFKRGINFNTDNKNPHVKTLPALVAPSNIRYRLSDGTEYPDTNVVSLYYESSPGVRTAIPSSNYSIQRIVLFSSNLVRIQYGQAKYNTMALAKQAIVNEPFVAESNMSENGLLRGYLIVRGNTTALNDTDDAVFIEADKFGTMPLGSSGGVTTLQQAYTNSIVPQITTTTALGALTIRRGSASDNDNVLNLQNGTGGTTMSFVGNGSLVLPKTTGVGIKVDTASPTYGWRDLIGVINTRTGGATVPSYVAYIGGIYQWSFGTAGGVNEVFNEYHILHDYVPSSDMYIHAHWSTIAAPTGDVNWMFEITQAKGYNQAAFSSPVTIPVVQTSTTAYNHMIAEVRMSAPNGLIASAINVSITSGGNTLKSASPLFTSADIGRTIRIVGAGTAGGNLDTTITAFASSTSVTVGNNASTTVTSQPNFRYRVIDSNQLEIDGLILVRTWRDSNRTADTLNVAPFLHFVDIHYQSTGLPTKDKNYPFYF